MFRLVSTNSSTGCLLVMTMLSEARVQWFDTIWVTLWALLVVTQSQTNLVDDRLFFQVTVTNDVRHFLNVCREIKENRTSHAIAMVMSATSQPLSMTCSFNATSHTSTRASTFEYDDALDVMNSLSESLTSAWILAIVCTQKFDPNSSTATPFFF